MRQLKTSGSPLRCSRNTPSGLSVMAMGRSPLVPLLLGVFVGLLPGGLFVRAQPSAGGALGPLDGDGLPPTDLNRVSVGTMAPDFRLTDETGAVHQLSGYRGKRVVLVIYRGHW